MGIEAQHYGWERHIQPTVPSRENIFPPSNGTDFFASDDFPVLTRSQKEIEDLTDQLQFTTPEGQHQEIQSLNVSLSL